MTDHLLEVRGLSVDFHTAQGTVHAVRDVNWHLDRGECLAILGESGSGKSVSASAVMNLIDCPPGEITWGLMVSQGRPYLTTAWWLSFWPGLAIILTTLSLNLLSNWMRTALDPVQRWRLETPKQKSGGKA